MPRGRNPYPGASPYTDRHGKVRWRFRRKGQKDLTLPADGPGAPGFRDAYEAAVAGSAVPAIGASRSGPGTFSALIRDYYVKSNFRTMEESTQVDTRRILEAFRAEHGHKRVAHLRRDHIERMMDASSSPVAANGFRKRLRWLLDFAVSQT